uniref:Uncharacterized protein n=1 Tax=Euplotes crassus TaxID=5936 RepID=A0A7S3KBZ1_EUPCR|mmetsp:Transcript_19978/g.19598  ORF Transcript_19978/g.19598 Transcript_19978/m.19598 type:complete len:262 (+) Transcript_19978:477-1262(+)
MEKLKTTIPYLIQLLNKTVANSISSIPMEEIKAGFVFYMGTLFDIEKDSESSSQIVNFTQIALKGLNGLFSAGSKDPDMMERVARFSKFCFEESLAYLFTNAKRVFASPVVLEGEDQSQTQAISEDIKFITNIYLNSTSEQKEVIIDTIVKMFLGIVVGVQENQIQRTKPVLTIINSVGEGLYSMIVKGDVNLAKGYIATSLTDQQKQMLQNIIKAIATSKKAQEDQKAKNQVKPGQRAAGNPKFRENKGNTKLATKIGKV